MGTRVLQMASTIWCAFFILFLLFPTPADSDHANGKGRTGNNIDVGVILDLGTSYGIVSNYCVAMAVEDIPDAAGLAHHTPRLALHVRHSATGDHMGSANAVHDLVHNVGVRAIIGSQLTSDQSAFLGYMSGHAHIPFISLTTSRPFMSSNPYMLGIDTRDISQARAIAAVVKAYQWEEVALLHDNTNSGTNLISLLTHDLHEAGLKTIHQRVVTPPPRMNIHGTLQEVAAISTKVFIVHTSFSLAADIFKQARILGMMSDGYAWIITSEITNRLNYMDRATMDSMQGVLGLRNEVPKSAPLSDFEIRWKRKMKREQPEVDVSELDVYALLAYDAIHFLAKSAQRERVLAHMSYIESSNSYGLDEPLIEGMLIDSMLSTQTRGLTGELQVVGGQFLMSEVFEIVNIAGKSERPIGYWTRELGLCRDLNTTTKRSHYSTDAKDLAGVIWPGGVVLSPRRRIAETKLVVGYPVKDGYYEYVKEEGPGRPIGFSIEIFEYVMNILAIEFEWKAYPRGDGHNYYDRLVEQAEDKTMYGAIAGDVTITASRAEKVDFSQPYADSDVAMIVLAEDENDTNNPTWFLKPMSLPLWGATFGILFLKGLLVWFFEYRSNNQEFHGTYSRKVGKILALSFSSFVFADSDKLKCNYSRSIVILWTVLSFILVTGYTANLTSMLTVQRLLPQVRDLQSLIDAGEWIGYQSGSFVEAYLIRLGAKHLRPYSTDVEYVQALTNKSVVAIVDEMPYIRVFLGLHSNFAIVDRINHTGGLGFVFPKNSSLVPLVSQALLKLRESEEMCLIERKWFGNDTCSTAKQDTSVSNNQLTLRSFKWLYIFILSAAALTLIAFLLFARGSEQVEREGANHDQQGQVVAGVGIPRQGDEGRVRNAGRREIQFGRMDNSFYETSSETDNFSEQPLNPANTPGASRPNQSVSRTSRGRHGSFP